MTTTIEFLTMCTRTVHMRKDIQAYSLKLTKNSKGLEKCLVFRDFYGPAKCQTTSFHSFYFLHLDLRKQDHKFLPEISQWVEINN